MVHILQNVALAIHSLQGFNLLLHICLILWALTLDELDRQCYNHTLDDSLTTATAKFIPVMTV